MPEERLTLLYLAHLPWAHVWQRPQQLTTRLAQHYRVLYVDPPELADEIETSEVRDLGVDQGVRVLQPRFPAGVRELTPAYWQAWQALFPTILQESGSNTVLCVSSPYAD